MKLGRYPVVQPGFSAIRGAYEDDRIINLTLGNVGENRELVTIEAQFPLSDATMDGALLGHLNVSGQHLRARCFEQGKKEVVLEIF